MKCGLRCGWGNNGKATVHLNLCMLALGTTTTNAEVDRNGQRGRRRLTEDGEKGERMESGYWKQIESKTPNTI